MDRFIIACCIFSFITGIYAAVIIEQSRGCTVEIGHNNVFHVYEGKSK